VPQHTENIGYRVNYGLYSDHTYAGYVGNGYYSSSGTTTNYSAATIVDVGSSNISGKDMTIYTGNTITGMISMPGIEKAPAGGINGSVSVSSPSNNNNFNASFYIPAGGSSASYTVTVPVDTTITGYLIRYSLYSNNTTYPGYVRDGYYSTGGTTTNYSSAKLININQGNADGVNLTIIKGVTISGVISLPGTQRAPSGGIEGSVYIAPLIGGSGYNANFTIAAGTSSGEYTATLPANDTAIDYSVRYSLYSGDSSRGYIETGYYSAGETITNSSIATPVKVGAVGVSGINLTLLKGTILSGIVSLPGSQKAPSGGIEGSVSISSQNGGGYYGVSFKITSGTSSAPYTVTVPETSATSGYSVSYYLYNNSSAYLSSGYYAIAGTTKDASGATPVVVGAVDLSEINLTLIKGIIISGTVSLPGDEKAPTGGLEGGIGISPVTDGNSYNASFKIAAGTSSATYTATVATTSTATGYRVSYNLYNNSSAYLSTGYYSAGETITDPNAATPVVVGAVDLSDVNLTLIKGTILSGTVSLPGHETAPIGGLEGTVFILAENGGNGYTANFKIAEGTSSGIYTATIPANSSVAGFKIYYYLYDAAIGYLDIGYYSGGGTTMDSNTATPVVVGSIDVLGINLTILKDTLLSGTVSLPGDKRAPAGGLGGNVYISARNGSNSYNAHFNILEGESNASYSATLPANTTVTEYSVMYSLDGSNSEYEGTGYYSTDGTTTNSNSAAIVNVTMGAVTEVNLTLLATTVTPDDHGDTIASATVISIGSNTAGQIDPAGDIDYFKFTPSQTGSYSFTTISSLDTYGYLYGALGNELNLNDDDGDGNNFMITQSLQAGQNYYVKVKMYNPYQIGSYQLSVTGTTTTPVAVTGVTLNTPALSLTAGQTEQLTATIMPDNADDKTVTWSVFSESGSNIATVSNTGLVTAKNAGTAVIRATSNADATKYAEANVTVVNGKAISGIITLPEGVSASADGLGGNVFIEPQDGSNGYNTNFYIPVGERSVSFSKTLPADTSTSYRVRYSLNSSTDYLGEGYYSTNGTTNVNSATWINLNQGNRTDINLTLLTGRKISGTFSLPGDEKAPIGGLSGQISIASENGAKSYYTFFNIPVGGSSASYTTHVPVDASIAGYHVIYSLYSNSGNYVRTGYYSLTGTTTSQNATIVSINEGDASNINLTPFTGHTISGTISLPNNELAAGLQGQIYVSLPKVSDPNDGTSSGGGGVTAGPNQQNVSVKYSANFTILPGANSASYTTEAIPVDATILGYCVNYNLYNNPNYVSEGYYSSTAGTTASKAATLVNINDSNAEDINLTILKGHTISGAITLPNNATAIGNAIYGVVYADPQNGGARYFGNFSIPVGASSAEYSAMVPSDTSISGYRVNYSLYDNYGYVGEGYFSASSGTTISKSATLVNAESGNATNINLTLLTGNTVSGTISLPAGVYAPANGIELSVSLDPLDGGTPYSNYFYLAGGRTSVSYSVMVPVDASITGYRVSYGISNKYAGYLEKGYYSTTGTTTLSSATPVDVRSGNAASIDMVLLTGNTTSSAISLNKSSMTLAIGQTEQLTATILPANADQSVTWSVSSTTPASVAIVSPASGLVTAVNVGTAVIRATSNADATKQAECTVTVTKGTAIGLSATPVVKIGVNPDAGDNAGLFIGLETIKDPANIAIEDPKITGYQIEVDFDPTQVSIADVVDSTTSGALFSKSIEPITAPGKILVTCASGASISNFNKLFFLPITLKGSTQDLTTISVKFLEVKDANLKSVQIPSLENIKFQRGKIHNGESGDPDLADAIAGLQYLAKLKNPGLDAGDVNLVNMASIYESAANAGAAKANIKDIISLMQYSVDLRDQHFNLKTTSGAGGIGSPAPVVSPQSR